MMLVGRNHFARKERRIRQVYKPFIIESAVYAPYYTASGWLYRAQDAKVSASLYCRPGRDALPPVANFSPEAGETVRPLALENMGLKGKKLTA